MVKIRRHIMIEESLNEQVKLIALKEGCSEGEVINTALRYFIKHGGRDYPELIQVFDAVFKRNSQELLDAMKKLSEEQKIVQTTMNNISKNNGIEENKNGEYLKRIADTLDSMNLKNV